MPDRAALASLDPARLERLVEAGRDLVSELRVEQVLDRLLDVARELTGARYAAMGVLDAERVALSRFITRGIDAETHRAIGDLPRGRGILGVLIDEPRPLRLHDVGAHPRSFGFPPRHPPMGSFLGVPVMIRGHAWGNLYLTEKAGGGDFDERDEASVVVLADWAAIAIENAGLYETLDARRHELERVVRGFEATAAITQAVGAETDLDRILELIVARARTLVAARSVVVLLRDGDTLRVAAGAGQIAGDRGVEIAGSRAGEALLGTAPVRIDDVDADPLLDSARLGVPDASSALLVPLIYRERRLGLLCAFDRTDDQGRFDGDDEQVLRACAASAAIAVAIAKSVEAGRLEAMLESAEAERRRWARELHDETLQGLGGLKMLLSVAARGEDEERTQAAARSAMEQISQEITNLRAIIADLRPAALDELGLGPALQTLAQSFAAREGVETSAAIELGGTRLDPDLETAVYRVAQEALTNVARHAGARTASVALRAEAGQLLLTVRDDGAGFDPRAPSTGLGLRGMRERVGLTGGRLDIASDATGTRIAARFPCAP
ncbi:MAG: GAF domain-containing sensor histidine kinase [Solirubrobacteraceae bacterium]|nr:GAF domain-containing sensor histidine kinase [Solirubrobacteraceae bacterium]